MTLYLAMAIGEMSLAATVIVIASLRFARWAIERADRLTGDSVAFGDAEVRASKISTLKKLRLTHENELLSLASRGFTSRASEQRIAIDAIDRELAVLGQWNGEGVQ